jgi:hypothetical protein
MKSELVPLFSSTQVNVFDRVLVFYTVRLAVNARTTGSLHMFTRTASSQRCYTSTT